MTDREELEKWAKELEKCINKTTTWTVADQKRIEWLIKMFCAPKW